VTTAFVTVLAHARSARHRAARAAERGLRDARLLPGESPPRTAFAGLPASAPPGVTIVPASVPARPPYPPAKTVGVENAWFQRAARDGPPPRPAYVARLERGRIAGAGGIAITADGTLLADTAWDAEQLRRSGILSRHRLPPLTWHTGRLTTLVTLWPDNYFHWLLDALPRLAVLEAAGNEPDAFLVPERLPQFALETLALLDVPSEKLIPHRRGHVGADELVWPSPAGHTGHPSPFAVEWLRDRMRRATEAPAAGSRRLYVTRRGLARGWSRRHVVNERDVLETLQPLGFETVQPDKLSVAEQVRLFAEAEVAVGPHGGWVANAMFSKSLTLVELFEPDYVNPCGYSLAAACNHAHWYLMCETRPVGDLLVPIADLEQTLRSAGVT
jgi:hypothetical protein